MRRFDPVMALLFVLLCGSVATDTATADEPITLIGTVTVGQAVPDFD